MSPSYAIITPPQATGGPETEVEILLAILYQLGWTPPSGGTTPSGPSTVNVNGFIIPKFDHVDLTYYQLSGGGNSNNIKTQVFKSGGAGGTTVGTLTYAYAAGGVANDDLVTAIQQS